jgi:hypothetical protein
MKLIKIISLAVAVGAFGTLHGSHVAAQSSFAPTLTVTTNGNVVTILWTTVTGALGYNLQVGTTAGGSEIATITLPSIVGTRIVVTAPTGVYYLRVRGVGIGVNGPFSNEAYVNVNPAAPPPTCSAPAAPDVNVTVEGPTVTVSWPPVAGAVGYQIQYALTPEGTDLEQLLTTTSHTVVAPWVGTFYVRVRAASACGQTVSPTIPFTVSNLGGSGPRTPDPAPGQLLPVPDYGWQVVQDMARAYPQQLSRACKTNHEFLYLLLRELRRRDSRWGLNWKRGNTGDMSSDIIAYNPTDAPDEGNGRVYIFDVIGAECEANRPGWIDQTAVTRSGCSSSTEWCTRWTLQPYLQAGFPADPRQ